MKLFTAFASVVLMVNSLAFTNIALAQPMTPKEEIKASDKKILGWSKNAKVGLNFSMNSSSDVVGQTDGTSQTYGLNLKAGMTKMTERSEWRNLLTVNESSSRSPAIPRYVKASDEIKLETIYLYSLENHPRVGPYAKGEISAPMFKGEDVRSKVSTYVLPDATTVSGTSLRLTDGFKPLNTKESVGFFWKAVQSEKVKLEVRTGVGALQVQADGQLAVTGTDAATGNILTKELKNVSQAGLEFGATLKGIVDEKTSYEAGVDTLTPFINDKVSGDDRDAIRLTNIEGYAGLKSKITTWASFGYDYKVKIQPQVIDRTQQTHMMVLTVNYDLL